MIGRSARHLSKKHEHPLAQCQSLVRYDKPPAVCPGLEFNECIKAIRTLRTEPSR